MSLDQVRRPVQAAAAPAPAPDTDKALRAIDMTCGPGTRTVRSRHGPGTVQARCQSRVGRSRWSRYFLTHTQEEVREESRKVHGPPGPAWTARRRVALPWSRLAGIEPRYVPMASSARADRPRLLRGTQITPRPISCFHTVASNIHLNPRSTDKTERTESDDRRNI